MFFSLMIILVDRVNIYICVCVCITFLGKKGTVCYSSLGDTTPLPTFSLCVTILMAFSQNLNHPHLLSFHIVKTSSPRLLVLAKSVSSNSSPNFYNCIGIGEMIVEKAVLCLIS